LTSNAVKAFSGRLVKPPDIVPPFLPPLQF